MRKGREEKRRKVENPVRILTGAFLLIVCAAFPAFFGGCSSKTYWPQQRPEVRVKPTPAKKLANMGFTIQAGAFSRVENAARLTEALRLQGLDAYYFVHSSGLYKVRFGNFTAKAQARKRAETLRQAGVIAEYYIVTPEEYNVAQRPRLGDDHFREQLIKTAHSFIGVPYLWGGTSRENGFDCSGLVMAVYQLNGLDLPRTSREQFEAGTPVDRDCLRKGDLVFFANGNGAPISHVGIYIGDGRFIHAPATGKNIRVESLDRDYYARRYAGSRTYL
ncbi:C40 family peptidase [Syntrophus aciditrophicus]|uniref:Cell wall-associated hydrolase n=1 Tax=Syntrophus aciditrophicus (strain SB) TaxID=56780 RepID=Q2LSW7_SYNAS|nr:NlpC/P60 family protein [Syntrophus aciditrophicus]ABC77179.1 cell wall-associated hydrolase [Syntrophus aciditrophicus SB]